MKTISLPYHSKWVTEKSQVELEKALSQLDVIKDFVFNGDRLEVTFEDTENQQHVNNMVSIQIQYAMYISGRDIAYDISKSLIFK